MFYNTNNLVTWYYWQDWWRCATFDFVQFCMTDSTTRYTNQQLIGAGFRSGNVGKLQGFTLLRKRHRVSKQVSLHNGTYLPAKVPMIARVCYSMISFRVWTASPIRIRT